MTWYHWFFLLLKAYYHVILFLDPGDIECEPDEYSELVKALRKSGIIKDHRSGLRTYKNSFKGKDFVDWVVKTKELGKYGRRFLRNSV